jgi:hypothetical protein
VLPAVRHRRPARGSEHALRTRGAFDGESQDIGLLFASHAAVALAGAEHEEQLREAVATRDLIGQAKGILMERRGLPADQAFDVLRRASQDLNVKLRDVAATLAERRADL